MIEKDGLLILMLDARADHTSLSAYQRKTLRDPSLVYFNNGSCPTHEGAASKRKQLISIDCWEELLEFPDTFGRTSIAIVRAAKSWNARFATICVYLAKRIPYAGITDNETFVHRLRPRSGRYA